MPSKTQPFRLPQRFDSPTLAKLAIPGEPTVIVRAIGVGSTAPFEYSDRNGRQAVFRYEREYDTHVLKVPASVWNANKGFMAHELMDQRRLPHPLVVTVDIPTAEATSPIKGLIDAMKADPDYAWGWHCKIAMSAHDSGAGPHSACNRGAALFLSLLSDGAVDTSTHPAYAQTQESPKSQDGQAAKSSGPYPEAEGSSPSPATNSPEMDASGNSKEASDVVVGQVSEQPGASATLSVTEEINALASQAVTQAIEQAIEGNTSATFTGDQTSPFSSDGSGTDMPTGWVETKSYGGMIREKSWNLLANPMRFKALVTALAADNELKDIASKEGFEEAIKTAIQEPLSTVELGHAGWVKRREPQA